MNRFDKSTSQQEVVTITDTVSMTIADEDNLSVSSSFIEQAPLLLHLPQSSPVQSSLTPSTHDLDMLLMKKSLLSMSTDTSPQPRINPYEVKCAINTLHSNWNRQSKQLYMQYQMSFNING